MGSGGDSVGVSNLAWLFAPMVLLFKLANDDLVPISPVNHLTFINSQILPGVFKTSRAYACANAPPLGQEFIANSIKASSVPALAP